MRSLLAAQTACAVVVLCGAPHARGEAGDPDLRLELSATAEPDGSIEVHAAFRSSDGRRVSFFLPAGSLPDVEHQSDALSIETVAGDGTVFVPYALPSQPARFAGPIGTIEPLVGARVRGVVRRSRLFVRVPEPEQQAPVAPVRLSPGRYSIRCSYSWHTSTMPVRERDGSIRHTAVDALWTGTVHAEPVTVDIPPAEAVRASIGLPAELGRDGPCDLAVSLRNDAGRDLVVSRSLLIVVDCSPNGPMDAPLRVPDARASGAAPESETLVLRAGEELRFQVDLLALEFDTHRHKLRRGRLPAMVEAGAFRLELQVTPAGNGARAISNGLWRHLEPAARR